GERHEGALTPELDLDAMTQVRVITTASDLDGLRDECSHLNGVCSRVETKPREDRAAHLDALGPDELTETDGSLTGFQGFALGGGLGLLGVTVVPHLLG